MVVSWPARINDAGGLRTQFHHVIDIVPTILEAAGIPEPVSVNGVAQKPIEGVSMLYTFDDATAKGTRRTQYFEMFGNRAIYHDGWVAACFHGAAALARPAPSISTTTRGSSTTSTTTSASTPIWRRRSPLKLKQLQELFMAEAGKYNVLPLDDRAVERAGPATAAEPDRGADAISPTTPAPAASPKTARPTSRTGRTRSPRTSTCRPTAATACWWRRGASSAASRCS